jgi:hypothetical protein
MWHEGGQDDDAVMIVITLCGGLYHTVSQGKSDNRWGQSAGMGDNCLTGMG